MKKLRMPKRLGREMLSSDDDVDEVAEPEPEVLESARDRWATTTACCESMCCCDAVCWGWGAETMAAAAAAAASCSLECRREARRRRELSGLRRRSSRITGEGGVPCYGPFIWMDIKDRNYLLSVSLLSSFRVGNRE